MRKYKILFILLLMILTYGWSQAQTIAMRVPDTTVVSGSILDIPVYADSSLTGKNVISYTLQLTFNQNYFQPLSVIVSGTLSSSFGTPSFNSSVPGKITIAGAGSTPLTGKGILLYIRFQTVQTGGSSPLSFNGLQNNFFNEGSPAMSFTDSYLFISAVPFITVYPDNQIISKAEQFQFNVSGGIAPFQWFVTDPSVATIDSDGLLTGNQFGFTKVISEDANGIRDTTGLIEIRAMRLSIPDGLSQLQGYDIDIPVNTSDLSGLNIYSGNFTLNYYQNILTPKAVVQTGTLLESLPAPVVNLSVPGKVSVAFAGSIPLSGSGTLIYIRFHVSDLNTGSSWMELSNSVFNEDLIPTYTSAYFSTINLATLTISPYSGNMIAGETIQLSVYGGGIAPFTWTVNDTVAASINQSGLLTANKSGNVTISVSDSVGAYANSGNFLIYDARITMPDTSICPETPTFNYPILISSIPSGTSILSMQAELEYDTTYLTFMDIETSGTLTQGWSSSKNSVARQISIAVSGTSPFNSAGVIANLKFTLKPNFVLGSYATIYLKNILLNEGNPLPYFNMYEGRINAAVPSWAQYITGTNAVCQGQQGVAYSVPVIAGASGYVWTIPAGATITSGNNTNSITVSFSDSSVSDYISVYGTNGCGNGSTSGYYYVSVNSLPDAAGIITGKINVYQGQTNEYYYVQGITNASTYIWTLPSGAIGTSTSNNIYVDYSVSAVSGNITVNGNNSCGDGSGSSLAVAVYPTSVLCEAQFNYTSGGAVMFTDQSLGDPTTWSWDFGDGTYGTGQNPLHMYAVDGAYDVTLSIYNSNTNCASSITNRVISGNIACQADFEFVIDTLSGIVNFTSNSQNVNNYYWTFGDGTSSTLENPGHQYSATGSYMVSLAVRNSTTICMDQYSQLIQVGTTDCQADFNFIVDNVSLTVNFKDNSKGQIEYYYWDFGDGTFTVDANPDHDFSRAGIYMVDQFVIDLTNACVDHIAQPVQVGTIDCSASFITYIDSFNYTAYFTNRVLGVSTAKLWSFGDGSFSTEDNPSHRFPGTGIYSAGLNTYDLNSGCMDYFTEMLMIGGLGNDCSADFLYRADPLTSVTNFYNNSIGDIVESLWNFGDETENSPEMNPVHIYTKAGYYNVCLTVTNSQGIRNMGCKWVLIEGTTNNSCLANFMFTIDSTNLTARFVNHSFGDIDSYTWNFGDGSMDSASTVQNPGHVYGQKGYYMVQLKVENNTSGCVSSEYKLLNMADIQILKAAFAYEAQDPVKKFAGYPVDLVSASSGDGATIEWDFGDKEIKKDMGNFTVMDSTSRIVRHYYKNAGKYEVCLRISDPVSNKSDIYCRFVNTKNPDAVGQLNKEGFNLTVYPNPIIDFTTINYSLEKTQSIEIAIYDQLGRKIETLEKSKQASGKYEITWETKNATAGVYHLKLITDEGILTRQLVITK